VAPAAALLFVASWAFGQNVTQLPTNEGNMSGNLTYPPARHACACTADREFLDQMRSALAAQLAGAGRAARYTGRSDIRGIAATLHHDDLQTTSHLAAMARQAGLPMPPAMPPAEDVRGVAERVGDGTSPDAPYSDAAFVAKQIEFRQRTIAAFEKESQAGSDASLRAFARQRLPSLRDQVRELQSLTV